MCEIEEKALETLPVNQSGGAATWMIRTCLKRIDFEAFHNYLNSIKASIQFTVKMSTTAMGRESMAFLDTNSITN